MGRKSKLTKELIQQFHELLSQGNFVNWVCDYLNIDHQTYYNWYNAGESEKKEGKSNLKVEFFDTIIKAKAEAQLYHVKNIYVAAKDNPKYSEFYLERSDPKNWGQKTYTETKIEGSINQTITEMTDEELEKRAEEILKRRATNLE